MKHLTMCRHLPTTGKQIQIVGPVWIEDGSGGAIEIRISKRLPIGDVVEINGSAGNPAQLIIRPRAANLVQIISEPI